MSAKAHLQELKAGQWSQCGGRGGGGHVESGGKDAGEITSSTLVCKESMRTVVVEKHKGKSKRDFKVESDTLSFMF